MGLPGGPVVKNLLATSVAQGTANEPTLLSPRVATIEALAS